MRAEWVQGSIRVHSRGKRSDCVQVVAALIAGPEGFPPAREVMAGNTADSTTLQGLLKKIGNSTAEPIVYRWRTEISDREGSQGNAVYDHCQSRDRRWERRLVFTATIPSFFLT